MSSEFLRSNPALDRAIAECTNAEQIREVTKTQLVGEGRMARDSASLGMGVQFFQGREPESNAPLAASSYKFEHEFRYHPESGRAPRLLRANSQADLDALIHDMERTV